ncbi:helix-turn-helix domain-containing protein [Nonomuraea sp. NPDC049152]
MRFSTLTGICRVLGCQPGDFITVDPPGEARS